MSLRVRQADLFLLNMRTRMPFRYGIVSMTALPHLFLRCEVEIDEEANVDFSRPPAPPIPHRGSSNPSLPQRWTGALQTVPRTLPATRPITTTDFACTSALIEPFAPTV